MTYIFHIKYFDFFLLVCLLQNMRSRTRDFYICYTKIILILFCYKWTFLQSTLGFLKISSNTKSMLLTWSINIIWVLRKECWYPHLNCRHHPHHQNESHFSTRVFKNSLNFETILSTFVEFENFFFMSCYKILMKISTSIPVWSWPTFPYPSDTELNFIFMLRYQLWTHCVYMCDCV